MNAPPQLKTTAAILPIDTVKSIVQSQEGPARSALAVAAGLWKCVRWLVGGDQGEMDLIDDPHLHIRIP